MTETPSLCLSHFRGTSLPDLARTFTIPLNELNTRPLTRSIFITAFFYIDNIVDNTITGIYLLIINSTMVTTERT